MNTMLLRIGLLLCVLSSVHNVLGQVVYYVNELSELRYLELSTCKDTLITKTVPPSGSGNWPYDVAISPNGAFYVIFPGATYDLYEVNPQTGQMIFLTKFDKPIRGLVCDSKGVIWAGGFALYSYDPATGNQVSYGDFTWITGEIVGGDLTFRNGQLYMIDAFSRVREVNLTPPLAGKIIQDISGTADLTNLYGLFSIYYACDSVVTYTTGSTPFSNLPKMAQVNFETGAVTPIACNFQQGATMTGATTPLEFLGSIPCLHEFDLDTDNSSGATGKDYSAPANICPRDSLPLADTDLKLLYYKHIDSVQVYFLPGSTVPDGSQERLFASTATTAPGLNVMGNGTGRLTISAQPSAPDSVFRKVLATAVYHNSATVPTPGLRSIRLIPWSVGKVVDTAVALINLPAMLSSTLTLQTCPGTTVPYAGTDLPAGASQVFTFKNWLGCDSVVTVAVAALSTSASSLTLRACPGSTATYAGTDLPVGASQSFTFKNWLGCDSVVTVTVAALSTSASSLTLRACPGSTATYAGTNLPVGASQSFTFKNWLGCDSVVTVTVAALSTSASSLTLRACPGSTATYAGTDLPVGASQVFTFKNWLGCDSVVTVTVAALSTSASSLTLRACPGSTATYAGTDLPVGASQSFTFKNWLGCDSVVTVTVAALSTSASSLTLRACPGSTATYAGTDLPVGASQVFTFKNWLGCDSVVTVTVAALSTSASSLTLRACPGSTATYAGTDLPVGASQVFTFKNWLGCDSVVTVTVAAWPDLTFGIAAKKSCANAPSGSLSVQNPVGGTPPFAYSLDGAGFQSSPDFAGLTAGDYKLWVRDSNQCIFEDTTSVEEYGTLEVSLADAVLACDAASVRLVPAVSGDLIGLQFKWSDGSKSASLEADAAGRFWVEVSNVCQNIRREATVHWNDFGGDTSLVYVPNVFSTNAKQLENVSFRPFFSPHLTVVEYQLEVYDRWGSLVFRSEDAERGWEGVANHRLDEAGAVYIWHLQARVVVCGREVLLRRQGDVTLMK